MPHPRLLKIGTAPSRSAGPYTLGQSEFPREFARFVHFVGANEMIDALRRVDVKLGSLLPQTRELFGDRFYFHSQFIRFSEGAAPYQLDISDAVAVRAASLIAGINRIRDSLAEAGALRLKKTIIGSLRPDRDIRQLEHEIRCAAHFGRKGLEVKFADLEGQGRFDLLVTSPTGSLEVECKTVSEDTGSQIKQEMRISLMDAFLRTCWTPPAHVGSGVFVLGLKRSASACKNLVPRFKAALRCTEMAFDSDDFTLTFTTRPEWTELLRSKEVTKLQRSISRDLECAGYTHCFTKVSDSLVALAVHPHKPDELGSRIIEVIKDGADQCAGQSPGIVWLHFIGAAETEFLNLAQFSMNSTGEGLNRLVAGALRPEASPTDRCHVQKVLFSASGERVSMNPILGPDRLIVRAASSGGPIYEVPNPFCRPSESVEV
jgi:hypothetical protein